MNKNISIHKNNFDLLRLFASFLVVYGHAYPLTGNPSPSFMGNSVQAIGIKIFFVISGYLVMSSWQRDPSVYRFLIRRGLRIVPALVVLIVLSIVLIGPVFSQLGIHEYFSNGRAWSYLSNIALYIQYDLPGVFLNNPYPVAVNGSLWSLPIEVVMYLIGPLAWSLGFLFFRRGVFGITLAALGLMIFSHYFLRIQAVPPATVIYGSSVASFLDVSPYFLFGGVISLARFEKVLNIQLALFVWCAISLIKLPADMSEIALWFVLTYVVLSFGLAQSRAGDWLTSKGDISYGVYLYGFPVQQGVSMLLPIAFLGPWVNFLIALPIVIVLSVFSWKLVERPVLKLKPGKIHAPLSSS